MTAWSSRRWALGSVVAVLAVSSCGGGGGSADADDARRFAPVETAASGPSTASAPVRAPAVSSTAVATTSTAGPTATSSAPPTTAAATTTVPPTATTLAPTTSTLPVLPQPIAPPPEDGSSEPRVELGTIEIPRLGLQRPLQEGIRLSTLDRGPGHWPGTAMPGEVGNVVVAGHRVSHNADFRHVDQLASGDGDVFTTAAGRFTYLVESIRIVGPDALWIVDQGYEHTATLFACHPPGSVRERIVVHLRLAP
jgi:sortase A